MKKILSLLAAMFRPATEAELIADGIVPTSRRYDRELIDAMQKEAQA
jgi:hypothetical protein